MPSLLTSSLTALKCQMDPALLLSPPPAGTWPPRPHPRGTLRPRCPRPWSHCLGHRASTPFPLEVMGTKKYQISWESLEITQHVQLSPVWKCQRGSAMTIPSKIHGSGRGSGSQGWPELAEVGRTVVTSLAPAGPVLGRFIPFLTSFPKVSPWPTFPAFPFA